MVGYIPRQLAEDLAPLLDDGSVMLGRITQVTGGYRGKPTIGLNVEIEEYRR